MQIHKYKFNRDGKAGTRTLVFVGQHELDVQTVWHPSFEVEIEVEGETTAFVLSFTKDEAKRIRGYLDKMGY